MNAQLISMIALVRKETTRVLRIWVQTLIPPGITMSLYFIIFGTLIGRRIGEMDGYPYMEYIQYMEYMDVWIYVHVNICVYDYVNI